MNIEIVSAPKYLSNDVFYDAPTRLLKYKLLKSYPITYKLNNKTKTILLPKDFVTDLDSVPRIPIIYAKYKGLSVVACTTHDFGYNIKYSGINSKDECDELFYQLMLHEGTEESDAKMIYEGVHLFGKEDYNPTKTLQD